MGRTLGVWKALRDACFARSSGRTVLNTSRCVRCMLCRAHDFRFFETPATVVKHRHKRQPHHTNKKRKFSSIFCKSNLFKNSDKLIHALSAAKS